MRGLCGMLISKMADPRSPMPAHSFARIKECRLPTRHDLTATQAVAPCSDQTALSKVAEIIAGGALHEIYGELQQTNFPRVVYALDNGAERFVFVFDLPPGAINHSVD